MDQTPVDNPCLTDQMARHAARELLHKMIKTAEVSRLLLGSFQLSSTVQDGMYSRLESGRILFFRQREVRLSLISGVVRLQ